VVVAETPWRVAVALAAIVAASHLSHLAVALPLNPQ
jgi:hypothetical protein